MTSKLKTYIVSIPLRGTATKVVHDCPSKAEALRRVRNSDWRVEGVDFNVDREYWSQVIIEEE